MDRLALCGWKETDIEEVKEVVRVWAERVRTAYEEAAEAFLRILLAVGSSEFESLEELRKELEEIGREPRARRRKLERDRARAIEQRYRAEIHRFERERFCRRIFKPP